MTGPVERVPLTDEHLLQLETLWLGPNGTGRLAETLTAVELVSFGRIALEDVPGLLAELRASRAELAVLRPALRRVKQRIHRLLAEMDQEEADALEVQAGEYAGTFIETTRVRAALTGTETAEGRRAVTHLALIQASLPPGLIEVAGGTEQHCRTELERWVAKRGLRDGERALIVAVVAETVTEPGVGVYTVPAGQQ